MLCSGLDVRNRAAVRYDLKTSPPHEKNILNKILRQKPEEVTCTCSVERDPFLAAALGPLACPSRSARPGMFNPIPAGGGGQFDPPCSFFYITQKVLV